MSKKDYELIADTFKQSLSDLLYAPVNAGEVVRSLEVTAGVLSVKLANENPRFDKQKFLKACGLK